MEEPTTTRVRYCQSCGEPYTPIQAHSNSGTGSTWVPHHDRRGLPGEPCPAGGHRAPNR